MRVTSICVLSLVLTLASSSSSTLWQRHGHIKTEDPLGKHCFDVTVDTSVPHAAEWLNGNEYLYTSWKDGLCDPSVWPTVEVSTHPGVSTAVTERKLGHGTFTERMAARAAVTALAAPAPTTSCLHHIDVVDHKCFEACSPKPFKMKGMDASEGCPKEFSTVDSTTTLQVCADGVTNWRYCPAANKLNVSYAVKGELHPPPPPPPPPPPVYCHHQVDTVDHKCFEACAVNHQFKLKGLTSDGRCPGAYSTIDNTKQLQICDDGVTNLRYCPAAKQVNVTITTKGEVGLVSQALAAPPTPTCLHNVDTVDHKCFEACSPEGKTFASKGLATAGLCPASFNFVEKTKQILQCPDGVSNLRYCVSTALNVTMKTKGEAGVGLTSRPCDHDTKKACESSSICAWSHFGCVARLAEAAVEPLVFHHVTPGNHAHCLELSFKGGKSNAYYLAHGYQYTEPQWMPGLCDRKVYNWFNKVETIAAGVTQATRGVHEQLTLDETMSCNDATTRRACTAAAGCAWSHFGCVSSGAPSVAEAAAADGFVHMIEHSPGDHCLEVRYPGGTDSPFWKSEAWKYSAPIRPEWKQGKCDYSKWTSTDSKVENYDGYTAAKNSPYSAVEFKKYGYGAVAEDNTVTPMEM